MDNVNNVFDGGDGIWWASMLEFGTETTWSDNH